MNGRTKGQAEAAFSQAMVQIEKEYFGRGPLDAKTYFMRDMILVRLRGVLTLAEQNLAENSEGRTWSRKRAAGFSKARAPAGEHGAFRHWLPDDQPAHGHEHPNG